MRTLPCAESVRLAALLVIVACGAGSSTSVRDTSSPSSSTTPPEPLAICINEFVADNATGWQDETGAFVDWLELHNPTDAPIALDGHWLTDDPDDPWRHPLPALTLGPGGFLVLSADGLTDLGPTHLPFALDAAGEAIGLFREDGAGELLTYGPVVEDFSWARTPDCCPDAATCSAMRPCGTPGAPNAL